MNSLLGRFRVFAGACLLVGLFSGLGQAVELIGYMGPGAGLSMLGALFAVACVLFIAILAPILYPIRALRAWHRRRQERVRLATTPEHNS